MTAASTHRSLLPSDPLGSPMARAVFEAATQGIIVLDPQGIVLAANPAYCSLCGIVEREVVGRPHGTFSDHLEVRRLGDKVGRDKWVVASALRGESVNGVLQSIRNPKTGREFIAKCGAVPHREEGNFVATIITVEDVTETTLAQQGVEAALSAAEVGTWRVDLVDHRVWADANFARIYGLPTEMLSGGPREILYAAVHPDDLAEVTRVMRETAANGLPHEIEYRIVRPDGGVRWVLSRGTAEQDETGAAVRRIGSVVDVTGRKIAENALLKLNEELEERVKERTEELARANRDLEEFSYSVAHDLRAPLRAIVTTSRIVLEDAGERLEPEERRALERQATNAIRLARIVDDLLGFARLANAEVAREPFDLSLTARQVAAEIEERDWKLRPEIVVQDGMQAEGDPRLVSYALTNLIDNAVKFSPDGARVTIGMENGALFVRDQGVGFQMIHAHKLFVAFERLVDQETFAGTGVGLANVKRIVERHGGRVWAESAPEQGATFWFTLGSPS